MAKKEKDENEEDGPPKSKKKLIIFGAAGLVLLIGIGIGAYLLTSSSSPDQAPETQVASTAPANPVKQVGTGPGKSQSNQIGPMVEIEEFIVNLLDMDTTRYLKANITLEVDSEITVEEIQARMSQVRDAILLLAGNKNFSELRDLQGKMQLRAELLGHINTLLEKGQVNKIYFTNFVIQ